MVKLKRVEDGEVLAGSIVLDGACEAFVFFDAKKNAWKTEWLNKNDKARFVPAVAGVDY